MDLDLQKLVQGVLNRDHRSLARAITYVEEERPAAEGILQSLLPYQGRALCVGVVGPFGTGKSTLIDALVKWFRGEGKRVAVVAVDPSSPISGGAVLGDRVRMTEHSRDPGVFIRSMASRGRLGGLAKATRAAIRILDAAGYDIIFVETVGAGQSDIEISSAADVVIVVLMPQLGDQVQSLKAGLLEVGDLYVINKADMENAKLTEAILRTTLGRRAASNIVFSTVATRGEGIDALARGIVQIYTQLKESGVIEARRRARVEREIREHLLVHLESRLLHYLSNSAEYRDMVQKVLEGSLDAVSAARSLLEKISFNLERSAEMKQGSKAAT